MYAALLLLMGLLLDAPSAETTAPVARVRLGAGDSLGALMFGRSLHRQRILERTEDDSRERPFDVQDWLRRHAPADAAAR